MKTIETSRGIISAARITVRPEHRRELCLTISALLDRIRHEKGCRTYSFYGEVEDQNSLILIGEWDTLSAWENHIKSDDFAVLIGSVKLLGTRSNLDFSVLSPVPRSEGLGLVQRETAQEVHSEMAMK
jgi:quinol monooxygenase YgiN